MRRDIEWHWLQPLTPLVAVLALPVFARADVCLLPGSEAYRKGDIERAIRIYRSALTLDECRTPELQPLVRFSLGQALLQAAEQSPAAACDAQQELRMAADLTTDSQIGRAATQAAEQAATRCAMVRRQALPLAPAEPDTHPSGSKATSPLIEGNEGTRALTLGARLEVGAARLGWFDSTAVEVQPGVFLRGGGIIEWRLGRLALRAEPGVAWQTVGYDLVASDEIARPESGVWRWLGVDLAVLARHTIGLGLDGCVGASIAALVEATDSASWFGEPRRSLGEGSRSYKADIIIGIGYIWSLADVDLRLEARLTHGVHGVNVGSDDSALVPQRLGLGLEAIY